MMASMSLGCHACTDGVAEQQCPSQMQYHAPPLYYQYPIQHYPRQYPPLGYPNHSKMMVNHPQYHIHTHYPHHVSPPPGYTQPQLTFPPNIGPTGNAPVNGMVVAPVEGDIPVAVSAMASHPQHAEYEEHAPQHVQKQQSGKMYLRPNQQQQEMNQQQKLQKNALVQGPEPQKQLAEGMKSVAAPKVHDPSNVATAKTDMEPAALELMQRKQQTETVDLERNHQQQVWNRPRQMVEDATPVMVPVKARPLHPKYVEDMSIKQLQKIDVEPNRHRQGQNLPQQQVEQPVERVKSVKAHCAASVAAAPSKVELKPAGLDANCLSSKAIAQMQKQENETIDIQPNLQHQLQQSRGEEESQKSLPKQQLVEHHVERVKSSDAPTAPLDPCAASGTAALSNAEMKPAALVGKKCPTLVELPSKAKVPATPTAKMQKQENETIDLRSNQQHHGGQGPQQSHEKKQSQKSLPQQEQIIKPASTLDSCEEAAAAALVDECLHSWKCESQKHMQTKQNEMVVQSQKPQQTSQQAPSTATTVGKKPTHLGIPSSKEVVEIDVSQLIESDPDHIVSAASHDDDGTLRKLEEFARKLHASIKRIMNAKAKERRRENQARCRDGNCMENRVEQQAISIRVGQHDISVGEHVWVLNGRQYHAAVVKSLPTEIGSGEMATIQWDSTKTRSNVELHPDVIRPMHVEQENGECVSSSFSKRIRRKREQYSPPTIEENRMLAKCIKRSRLDEQNCKKVFAVGDQVEAKYNGRSRSWFAGTVVDVMPDDRYNIEYYDGDFDEHLSQHYIRFAANDDVGEGTLIEQTQENKVQLLNEVVAPSDFCFVKEKVFNVGDRVHFAKGRKEPWQQGTITSVLENGRYCVMCDFGERSMKLSRKFIVLSTQLDELKPSPKQVKRQSNESIKNDCPTEKSTDNLYYTEKEYRFLWNYYLLPVKRCNDELPSGMVLRTKSVPCNLLRYKNSQFRRGLHKKIKQLRRLGKEDEIYRMLKLLHDHDMSGRSGDGPAVLVNQILPSRIGDDIIIS